jgi:hypothetical protein
MMGVFHCRKCGTALTGEINVLSTKDPAVTPPALRDAEPVCDPGMAFKSHMPLQRSMSPDRRAPLEFVPQFWANPQDFEAAIQPTREISRLSGCCGLDGYDGPNMLCRVCKVEIGTMQSDCWTPLIFVPDPDNTEFRKTDP